MATLGQFIKNKEWRIILDSVMPGGDKWHSIPGDCLTTCPYFKKCKNWGPDDNICSIDWRKSYVEPMVLDVLFHVLNEFDFYNYGDIPHLFQTSPEISKLRQYVHEEVRRTADDEQYTEGSAKYRSHRYRERHSGAAMQVKEEAMKRGELRCQGCGIDYVSILGQSGKALIECHHLIPLSSLSHSGITKKKDLSLVCANCHRLIHEKRVPLSLNEVQRIWASTTGLGNLLTKKKKRRKNNGN